MRRYLRYIVLALAGLVGLVIFAHAHSSVSAPLAQLRQTAGEVRYVKLLPQGDQVQGGIYDPSVAYTADGSVGWLAYSSITGDFKPVGPYVNTHLARSTDGGAHWQFVEALNTATDATVVTDDGKRLSGVWRYEVPSLVHDPTDPDAGARWKLFAHRYFWTARQDRMVAYGWITLRTAADPGGEWSAELPLFGAGERPLAPYHHAHVDVNTLDNSLRGTLAYTEPGALANDDRLYLSLTALKPSLWGPLHDIILLASDDHGKSWRFISTLLTRKDAVATGCEFFDGSSLAEDDGRFFLLAAPMLRKTNEVHLGTVAIELESLANGILKRDAQHALVIAAYFAPQPGIFSGPGAGQSTYDSRNNSGGLLMPQFNLRAYPEVFQIYQTGRRIVNQRSRSSEDR
jgi:hypothetical protein